MCGSLTRGAATGTLSFEHLQQCFFRAYDLGGVRKRCFRRRKVGCNGDNENCDDFTSELTCPVQRGPAVFDPGRWLGGGNGGSGILLIECE